MLHVTGSTENLKRMTVAEQRDLWKSWAMTAMNDPRLRMCGITCNSGPNGEPLACAYEDEHKGPHSWATLPTFPGREGCDEGVGAGTVPRWSLEGAA